LDESIFDKVAEPGKGFYCENGMTFNNIRELEEALSHCASPEQKKMFNAHTAGNKNDFSSWIGDVFGLRMLAKNIFPIKDTTEMLQELRKYESEVIKKNSKEKQEEKKESKEEKERGIVKEEKKKEEKNNSPENNGNISRENIDSLKEDISNRSDRADKTFDRVKKIKHHSFYNKSEFEDSVEDVKERYEELASAVSSNRKEGLDMSIPTMILRNVHPKIVYFQVSQNKNDHDMITELLDEIAYEIKYAKSIKNKNLKEEIMKELGHSKEEKD